MRRVAAVVVGTGGVAWALPALAPRVAPVTRMLGVRDTLAEGDAAALTFDDGPHPEGTGAVLDALVAARATATFFLVGEQLERNPELAREVIAAGHAVGIHAHRHRLPLRLTPRAFADDLERARSAIAEAAGVEPRLYRPPYGKFSWPALTIVRRSGLEPVLWSRDSRDWSRRARPDSIAAALTADLRGGDVLLMHDSDAYSADGSHRRTVSALPRVIEAIRTRGLRLVAL